MPRVSGDPAVALEQLGLACLEVCLYLRFVHFWAPVSCVHDNRITATRDQDPNSPSTLAMASSILYIRLHQAIC